MTKLNVPYTFARPLCCLTEVGQPTIDEFVRYFGKPKVEISLSEGKVKGVKIKRGALCGSTWFIAQRLIGTRVQDAIEKAGLLFHNFPCLASMTWDDYAGETLMHIAGFKTKEAVRTALVD